MAKIDVTKIEGYADMTPEEKLKALEGYDVPDPDYSGYVKKDVFDKTASELAAKKKELTEKMSEDEQAKAKEAEERQALEEKYNALLRESAVSKNKSKLLGLGYDEKLADETAEAMADGDLDKVFKNQPSGFIILEVCFCIHFEIMLDTIVVICKGQLGFFGINRIGQRILLSLQLCQRLL